MRAALYFAAALLVALVAWFLRPSWDAEPHRYTYPERTPRGLDGWMKNP